MLLHLIIHRIVSGQLPYVRLVCSWTGIQTTKDVINPLYSLPSAFSISQHFNTRKGLCWFPQSSQIRLLHRDWSVIKCHKPYGRGFRAPLSFSYLTNSLWLSRKYEPFSFEGSNKTFPTLKHKVFVSWIKTPFIHVTMFCSRRSNQRWPMFCQNRCYHQLFNKIGNTSIKTLPSPRRSLSTTSAPTECARSNVSTAIITFFEMWVPHFAKHMCCRLYICKSL